MARKTSLIIARVLMVLYLGAVAYMLFANPEDLPSVEWSFLGIPSDKIAHFCLFFPFPVLAFFSLNVERRKSWKTALVIVAVFAVGCVLGGGSELIQGQTATRTPDVTDFLADAVGMAVSALGTFILLRAPQGRTSEACSDQK